MSLLAFLPLVEKVFDKVFPDPQQAAEAKLRVLELQQKGELAFLEADSKVALAQAAINLEDAKSSSLYKSGWRPYTAWICAAGFTWAFVARPIAEFVFVLNGYDLSGIPDVDTGVLVSMLGALLGLGGFRTYERYKGVEKP